MLVFQIVLYERSERILVRSLASLVDCLLLALSYQASHGWRLGLGMTLVNSSVVHLVCLSCHLVDILGVAALPV